jgi:hypothetical protein
MRGSIGVRIASLTTRRRPRILFSTHIGSTSRVVSVGIKSGGECSPWRVSPGGLSSGSVSRMASRRWSWSLRVVAATVVSSGGGSSWRRSRTEWVIWIPGVLARGRVVWSVRVHGVLLLRCLRRHPSVTKRKESLTLKMVAPKGVDDEPVT